MTEKITRINSPEQLNSYIRITKPGVWIILAAIIAFLAGFFIWIFTGELEISFEARIFTQNDSSSIAFLNYDQISRLKQGMTVRIRDTKITGTVTGVSDDVISDGDVKKLIGSRNFNSMKLHEHDNLFLTTVKFAGFKVPERVTEALFITEKIKPVHFLFK